MRHKCSCWRALTLCPKGGEPEEGLCGSPRPGRASALPLLRHFLQMKSHPAGEQAPIVKGWGLRERVPFRPLKIAALTLMSPHGMEWPILSQQHGPCHPHPTHP